MEKAPSESLPRELGIVPFVAVTGRPTEAAVRATVARVDAQGAGAFLVYARSGLEIEYMGEAWLRAVAWFCDEAARRGLRVWLYDEFNWPSGTCRGRVPAENDAWRYAELGVFPAPGGAVRFNGDPVRALRALSVPGVDEIYTRTDPAHAEWTTLALLRQATLHHAETTPQLVTRHSSLVTPPTGGIVELFACGPCDLPPARLLDMVRLAARHGATRFVTCMEAMDQRGLVEKHGFLAPTGSLHPWWEKHARAFAEEVRRIVAEERRAASERPVVPVPFPHRAAALAAYAGAPAPSLDAQLAALDATGRTAVLD